MTYTLTVMLLIIGSIAWRKEKKQQIKSRISSAFQTDLQNEVVKPTDEIKRLSFSNRILQPIMKQLKQTFNQNISSEKREKLEMKLLQAGTPLGLTPVEYRIVQLAIIVLLPLIFGLYGLLLQMSGGAILFFVLFGSLIGGYLPRFYLNQKTAKRNKLALRELPDFLDLLTVSMEAGLGFDAALSKVVAKNDGVLSKEFQRCLEEMRLGKTRRESLSGVRKRLLIDDIHSLIGSILQAEQLGIGMVQMLNVQSLEIRGKRKQRAEEQSMKAPIKMLFPLVLFIFPCIFIVILGPVVINLVETLL
nr:type II secretion system F family protein [Paraliobacillus quinghaiensis]